MVALGRRIAVAAPKPESAVVSADRAYHAAANLLLSIAGMAISSVADREEREWGWSGCAGIARCQRLEERIVARLDDPANAAADPAQRAEAERLRAGLFRQRQRLLTDVRRQATALAKVWTEVDETRKEDLIHDIAHGWYRDPMWAIVATDPALGRNPVLIELSRAHAAIERVDEPTF